MKKIQWMFMVLLAVLSISFVACGGDDDPTTPTPTPTPTPAAAKIDIPATENTKPVFGTEGGVATVKFTASQAWTASATNTRADDWLSVTPTSGMAGTYTLTITSKANDTYDERGGSIIIKSGTASQTIVVTQKQKDALLVTSDKVEVESEGGEINVEVNANIEFSVSTDVDWITQANTRAMQSTNLAFSISENEETTKREGHITISSGEFSETVTVYQAASVPTIIISQNDYSIGAEGGDITVEVKSNVSVSVTLPKGGWISESTTRSMSTNTYVFTISKNEGYDARSAEILFTNIENNLSEKITITQMPAETYTNADVENALAEAYSSFSKNGHTLGIASLDNYCFGDVAGADANKGSEYADQADFTAIETYDISPTNSSFADKWNVIYDGVKCANKVIDMVVNAKEPVPDSELIIAQAKFIKAVWLFEGIRMFGAAIPYISLEEYHADTETKGSNVNGSGKYIYIWDFVEKDLKDAIEVLPATWESIKFRNATLWMAKAMLAKLYLYWSSPYNGTNATTDHWKDAKNLLDDIMYNGVDSKGEKYHLENKYSDVFSWITYPYSTTPESVFEVFVTPSLATGLPGALGVGGWGFYQPSNEFVNSFMVDDNGLPISNYCDYEPLTKMSDIPESNLAIFTDPRLDFCVGRFGVPYWDYGIPNTVNGWVRDFKNGGVYMNKKRQPKLSDRSITPDIMTERRYQVIRFADILLMRAECAIHFGELSTALHLINQVRSRAANDYVINNDSPYIFEDLVNGGTVSNTAANYRIGLYPYFSNATEAHIALEREMRAEFGMEGHRWFDIARWGTVSQVLNSYRAYEGEFFPGKFKNAYDKNWVTFPIPNKIVQSSEGHIVQNINWK